jgi:hypothetical protein
VIAITQFEKTIGPMDKFRRRALTLSYATVTCNVLEGSVSLVFAMLLLTLDNAPMISLRPCFRIGCHWLRQCSYCRSLAASRLGKSAKLFDSVQAGACRTRFHEKNTWVQKGTGKASGTPKHAVSQF